MRTLVALTIAVPLALAASPGPAAAAPPQHFESDALTVTLPAGWRLAERDDDGVRLLAVKGAGRRFELAAGRGVPFVDLEGHYLVVTQDPVPALLTADAGWTVRAAATGDRLEVVEESARCGAAAPAAPAGSTAASSPALLALAGATGSSALPCGAGDGRLDLVALVDAPLLGHRYLLQLGHQRREEGVETAPLRAIVEGLRFR